MGSMDSTMIRQDGFHGWIRPGGLDGGSIRRRMDSTADGFDGGWIQRYGFDGLDSKAAGFDGVWIRRNPDLAVRIHNCVNVMKWRAVLRKTLLVYVV